MGILVRILTELKLSGIVLKKTNTIKQGDKVMCSDVFSFSYFCTPKNNCQINPHMNPYGISVTQQVQPSVLSFIG